METRVLIRSATKPYAAIRPPQWLNTWNLNKIGQLASGIFMIEGVEDDDGLLLYEWVHRLRWAENETVSALGTNQFIHSRFSNDQ